MAKSKKKQGVDRRVAKAIGADVSEILEAASQAQAHQIDHIGQFQMLLDAAGQSWSRAQDGCRKIQKLRANAIENEIYVYLADRKALLKSKTLSDAVILRSHQVRDTFERVMAHMVKVQEVRRKSVKKSLRPLTKIVTGPIEDV